MRLKILIAPDKFKGTLTAAEAAEAIADGWHKARPHDLLSRLPISDGGDGFGSALSEWIGAELQTIRTIDAAHHPCVARWWWQPKSSTALIEAAEVIGLARLPAGKFHPFELDTFGLGAVLRAAANKKARRCLIGIGGSATNDGGFGLARALGWRFRDSSGEPIEHWTKLNVLAEASPPEVRLNFDELTVAVDVTNPLLGVSGATRIYGPQKGLRTNELARAERNLAKMSRVLPEGAALANLPGSGASGGLGFGLALFLGARLESGFEVFAAHSKLGRHLRAADLVVTGEGRLDASTLMGKGVGELARRCRELGKPCFAISGAIDSAVDLKDLFTHSTALDALTSMKNAIRKPAYWLQRAAQELPWRAGLQPKA